MTIHSMDKHSKIYIAGHTGLVGSALVRALQAQGYNNLVSRTHQELDLTDQQAATHFFSQEKPEYVFLAAARVGGIKANIEYPARFLYENLLIQNNVIHGAYKTDVKKLLFFSSACVYPKDCPQPMKEDEILSGYFEPTNEAYAIAKITGMKMCEYYNQQYGTKFFSVIPANLYGPNDNFVPESSHVIPALIKKFHEAKVKNEPTVTLWGSGAAIREFLWADDLAHAALQLVNENITGFLNIGSGEGITIKDLAELVKKIVGFRGRINWDQNKPDGMPRKILDISKIKSLGWAAETSLEQGLKKEYEWFLTNIAKNNDQ